MSRRTCSNEYTSFRRGRITIHDVEAICQQISETRCTEKDACISLNINPLQFHSWKWRPHNQARFDTLFTRIKQCAIRGLIADIKDISDGDASIKLKPDWRAKEFLLKVRAPERFNFNTPATASASEQANLPAITESLRRAFAGPIIDVDSKEVSDTGNLLLNDSRPIVAPARAIPARKPNADKQVT